MLPSKTYLPVINSLRGLAATAICFYHFVLSTANYVEEVWVRTLFYYAQYGVPLFFVISGIVLPLAMLKNDYQFKHWSTFMLKRLVRLEPPYLVSLVLATAYLMFQTYRHSGIVAVSGLNFLLHLGYLIPFVEGQKWINPIYWSLAVEFQFYLFLSVAFIGLKQSLFSRRLLMYILLLGACFISHEKALIFRWLPLFMVGIVYVLQQHKIIPFKEFAIVSLFSFGLIYYRLGFPNLCVAIFTLSMVHYFPNYNPKYSSWLGKISYSLYLMHLIIGQALVNFLSHTYRLPYQKIIVILLGYTLSVSVAWLLYRRIEHPSKQASLKLQYTSTK
ncbi:MAG: acyltransferase [Aureispira sp.]|nr:acyltransferase [Aureispira sp.]